MTIFLQLVFWFMLAMVVLLLAIILGNLGAWYFAWVLGTGMIVLIAVTGTIMLDARHDGDRSDG